MTSTDAPLVLRLATPADRAALDRLAALDSAAPLHGDAFVADLDGRAVAALELAGGRTVADPFVRTAEVCELLRVHAAAATGRGRRRDLGRGRRGLLRALTPRAA